MKRSLITEEDTHSKSVRHHFRQEAEEYSDSRESGYTFLTQKRAVLRLLEGSEGKLLDIGCGAGHLLRDLYQRGFEVYGMDAVKEWVALAKDNTRGIEGQAVAHLLVADIENLPFFDGQFDIVTCLGVLEFVPNHERALRNMYRILRPGGIAIITVPNKIAPYFLALTFASFLAKCKNISRRNASFKTRREAFTVRRAVPWRLDRTMLRAGFRKASSEYCNFVFYPLNRFFPRFSLSLSNRLEILSQSKLWGWLGKQYIVTGIKT